jgi:hypothetical protein
VAAFEITNDPETDTDLETNADQDGGGVVPRETEQSLRVRLPGKPAVMGPDGGKM